MKEDSEIALIIFSIFFGGGIAIGLCLLSWAGK